MKTTSIIDISSNRNPLFVVLLITLQGFLFVSQVASLQEFIDGAVEQWNNWQASPEKHETERFVQDQFNNWKGSSNCQGFVDSFAEPFEFCDTSEKCITSKKELKQICQESGQLAGEIASLDIKPMWSPIPDRSEIAITGRQAFNLAGGGIACFDFVIVEKLETRKGALTSRLWNGYYKLSLGNCIENKPFGWFVQAICPGN